MRVWVDLSSCIGGGGAMKKLGKSCAGEPRAGFNERRLKKGVEMESPSPQGTAWTVTNQAATAPASCSTPRSSGEACVLRRESRHDHALGQGVVSATRSSLHP